MKILTTLAERDYFLGFAALLNSVVHYGTYVDKVIVGYRGELPEWLPPLRVSNHGREFTTPEGLPVELVELSGSKHMVHEKPKWFAHVSDVLAPDATEYFFFDSDIIINTRMSFFGEWVAEGIGICGDVNFLFDPTHPIRLKWAKLAEANGLTVRNQIHGFYNSGFLAWTQEQKPFIADWNRAFSILAPKSGDMKQFRVFDRTAMVQSTNQDSFNLAMMITEVPLSVIGPEAMSFINGMQLMFHPIGAKPWKRDFGKDFLQGRAPRQADIQFWRHVNGTALQPLPVAKANRTLKYSRALRWLGRFYHRL
ncbi:hypothetical protein CLV84_0474 [Neolewinella xylanilytica]|uniref:Uncharacterized protein n=1 Tax=Neolewinella xylanilytica TaxID=1514080 RepID=A0A2S6I7Q7_9BACT|nr:hypothetical protein [Neolewinella xylanilytica]PPK87531.1 hypothetical protein CLV84_0474 [Neolewinella xylanilytica]